MKKINSILIIVVLIFLISLLNKPESQIVAPSCFSKEDCFRPITTGFCNVRYDCIAGKCYSNNVLCPENCGIPNDEDKDGLIDCNDPDCWNDPYCSCDIMSYNNCKVGRCYCPKNEIPKWFISQGGNYCECVY